MEMESILKEFNEHVDVYARHRAYIERASSHSHKFNPAVVEKVKLDHEIKSSEVAEKILPLVPGLEEAVAEIDSQQTAINSGKSSAEERMEELTLRQVIGELEEDEFEKLSADLKSELESASERLSELNERCETIRKALARWVELAESAEQDPGVKTGEPEVVDDVEIDDIVVSDDEGGHVSSAGMVEDVSAVFGQDSDEDSDGAIETMGVPGDDGDELEAGDVELALVSEVPVEAVGDEIDISPVDEDEDDDKVDNRRALLLYQEGSPEEQIYPFSNDNLTIGRGRDNDIQIKNDSKVSRYHCKLFRRGNAFYVEDNKSSNGTLVDGELVNEKRLLGGEEVIIGETYFRFRITD